MSLSSRAVAVTSSDRHKEHRRCRSRRLTNRLLMIVSIVNLLVLSNPGNASAADPHDGEWVGSATAAKNGRCKSGNVTLTVLGSQAIGQAKFDADTRSIRGTVRPDRTFGGTIGFLHLTGQFVDDKFEGSFQSLDCAWNLILRRSRPRAPTSGRPFPRDPPPVRRFASLTIRTGAHLRGASRTDTAPEARGGRVNLVLWFG